MKVSLSSERKHGARPLRGVLLRLFVAVLLCGASFPVTTLGAYAAQGGTPGIETAADSGSDPDPTPTPTPDPEPTPDPTPDPDPAPDPEPTPDPDPAPDPDPDPEKPEPLAIALDAYRTDAHSQYLQRIGVSYASEAGAWKVSETLGSAEVGPRLRLAASVTWSDGAEYSQVSGEWKNIELTWSSSDSLVATVDNKGVVTATGEGTVTITVAGGGISSSVQIDVLGSGPYAVKVAVIDEEGAPYGDTRITFDSIDGASARQLYARVTYSDGTTASTLPDAADYQAHDLASLTWHVTNTDAGYINSATGNFKPLEDGVLSAVAEVAGGDPNVNAGRVSGSVWIVVNTGKHGGGNNPSDHLNVRVVYSDDESRVYEERTFSVDELRGIETASATYTLTKSGGSYITDSAQGIYLTTLLDTMGVSLNKVSHFRFSSNDNFANSGSITASSLFMERFYFPLYEFNRNMFGAVQVYPMLAYADSWKEGGSCDADFSSLNSGTCLRLLFGSTGQSDGWTSKSFKYVHTMTIVMDGKPPAGQDNEDGDSSGTGGGEQGSGGGDAVTTAIAGLGESDAELSSELLSSSGGEGGEGQEAEKQPKRKFQVFQMLSRDDSQVGSYDWENPLIPFFLPALLVVALAGAATTVTHYRRELA